MKNKILFIMQLPPPVHGASVVNKFIAQSGKVKADYDTRVLPLSFITDLQAMGSFSWKKIALLFPFVAKLIKQLLFFRPALVYYTIVPKGFAFYRDAFFVLIIKLFRRKIAFHLHSRGIQTAIGESRIRKMIYRFVYHDAYVICLADVLKPEFAGLRPKKILVLPNGVVDNEGRYQAKSDNPPVVLFLSNLFRAKGIYVFIELIKQLKARKLRFQANIIGMDGDLTESGLRQLVIDEGLHDIVTVSGAVYGNAKYTLLDNASIFVHPSLDEAFPLTILEAMQASLPVIASSVGAIPEMVSPGINGFLCRPGEVDEFVQSAEKLINNAALRSQMSRQSRDQYETKYTLQIFERNLKNVIDEIMAAH